MATQPLAPEDSELEPVPAGAETAPERLATPDDAEALLERVMNHVGVLADLTHADIAVFVRDGELALPRAYAEPRTVPTLFAPQALARPLAREEAPQLFRVLFDGHQRNLAHVTVIRGAPVFEELFPLRNAQGQVFAVVRSDMAMIEHERQRKRHATFRRAVARARELIVTGRMKGGERIGRLGLHDGAMVIDALGRIEYMSAPVEHLYRRLGYAENLVKTQLQELETNEYICFKAMERGVCMEQRIQEGDLVWIKRVIPLLPTEGDGWAGWVTGRLPGPAGAIVAIQDVTDELRKEQELKIKTAMIREIHHRVKNNLQTIAALLRLQARRSGNPDVATQLRESIGRILSVAVVHEFLSQEEGASINIHEVSNRILQEVRNGILDPSTQISLHLEGQRTFTLPAQQATSCALIINELVQNAVEHGFGDRTSGRITVRLQERGDSMVVEIEDDGQGLPPDFDPQSQGGLGLQIVRTLVREDLKGNLELKKGKGVVAVISFPRWIAKSE